MKKTILAGVLALAAGGAMAQVYAGAGVGLTEFNVDCTGSETCDNSSSGFKFYGGFSFTPNIAAEIGYIDFGTSKQTGYVYSTLVNLDLDATAVTAALALRGPLAHGLTAVGRLGVAQVKMTSKLSSAYGSAPNHSETKSKLYVGVGLEHEFTNKLKGTLTADFTDGEIYGESGSLRMLGVGLQYAF
ncbi:MAG TPA: outer membrane beta-barrel protein [Aquabacterium sp.]|nr:outer membrane beta-barrel protein [Aquabacterium sp.]